jgi:hypothetical protein
MARSAKPGSHLRTALAAATLAWACAGWQPAVASSTVYKWVDSSGVTHLSSQRPPAGVPFERMQVAGSLSASARPRTAASPAGGSTRVAAATPEAARRSAVVGELQNRECVVSLEAIDRLARSGEPVDPREFERLQQTAERTCSKDPATRRQQEESAARLRVSRGDACVDARNKLAAMLEPGHRSTREQLKVQQEFIESHCTAPVR